MILQVKCLILHESQRLLNSPVDITSREMGSEIAGLFFLHKQTKRDNSILNLCTYSQTMGFNLIILSFNVNFSMKQCDWLIYSWESLRNLIAEFTILLVLVQEDVMNLMSFVLTISKTQHFIIIFKKIHSFPSGLE